MLMVEERVEIEEEIEGMKVASDRALLEVQSQHFPLFSFPASVRPEPKEIPRKACIFADEICL